MHIYFKPRWHEAHNHTPSVEWCGCAADASQLYCKQKWTRVPFKTVAKHSAAGFGIALDVNSLDVALKSRTLLTANSTRERSARPAARERSHRQWT